MNAPLFSYPPPVAAKCASPETELEVDTMILDCLLYKATEALLVERKAEKDGVDIEDHERSDMPIQMVDSWVQIFKTKHQSAEIPESVRYRLRLLKFCTLYTRRLKPCPETLPVEALQSLRRANVSRASQLAARSSRLDLSVLPLSPSKLQENRSRALRQLQSIPENDGAFYGTSLSTSLRDLLPMFMSVTATRKTMGDWNITPRWMGIATEWLLQSFLEQYLICGSSSDKAFGEIFHWGWHPNLNSADDEEQMLNDLFKEELEDKEVGGWRSMLEKVIAEITPSQGESLALRLEKLASKHSIASFDTNVLNFLEALQKSTCPPIMVQMERGGTIEGLSARETEAFKRRVGFHRR